MQNLISLNSLRLIFLLFLLFNLGCATSQKGKIVEWSAAGLATGVVYGSTRQDFKDKNAMMYGAVGAAVGAIAGLYYFDPDKNFERLTDENKRLRQDLDLVQIPKVIAETPATFNTKIPEKYKKLINPGEWRISELDQWIEEGENRLIHQDKIMELIPPSLKPVSGFNETLKTERNSNEK